MTPTSYQAEIRIEKPADAPCRECQLIRILTKADTDSALWLSGAPLSDLPVSPHPDNTEEELLWAGQRQGNIHLGASLVGASFLTAVGCIYVYLSSSIQLALYYGLLFLAVSIITYVTFSWKHSSRPLPEKLQQLAAHKHALKKDSDRDVKGARESFQSALSSFDALEKMTPAQFEYAMSIKLEEEGFQVRLTQYNKDGGIDVEAIDVVGNPAIIQVKKYRSPVGVAVVREMIGIRSCRRDCPRTLIISLVGFTRGARDLAASAEVELRDIRSELLHL